MKRLLRFCKLSLVLILLVMTQKVCSQNGNKSWSVNYEKEKVFIENKGQFHLRNSTEPVLYAYDAGSTMIYFTAKGVTYSFLKTWKKEEKENGKEREREEMKQGKTHAEIEKEDGKLEYKTDVVGFEWKDANSASRLIGEEATQDYHSYSFTDKKGNFKNENYIKGYKKIIYKNIYPEIDIEYTFHPVSGIKYALIIHPGGDISKVKMNYSGNIKLKNNDLHIPTLFGDIIDHAPITFYENNKTEIISSQFIKTGTEASFNIGTYDQSKTIIIDPWTQTPALQNSNGVWECEHDAAGNVYIIGGDMPLKLLKFNPAGALQWTYTTTWDTANYWLGTMATDHIGNTYVTNGSSAALIKVDSSAALVYYKSGGSMDEYWTIAFNCDQTKLLIGGTRLVFPNIAASNGMIFDMNASDGNINSTLKVGYTRSHYIMGTPVTDIEEVRSITSADNSRCFFLTLDSIGAIDQNFSLIPNASYLFAINSTHSFNYKCENFRPNNGNSGICAIKAFGNFIYTQNGTTIYKRSLSNASILDSALITGGLNTVSFGFHQAGNSGIDIDSCGNVYVGSGNALIKYDANLNFMNSVNLPFSVFDVSVSVNGNVIVAGTTGNSSSTSRTGYIQSISSLVSCFPVDVNCDSLSPVGIQTNNPDVSTIQIYPNPSTGIINLYNSTGKQVSVTVYNMLGELLLKNESNNKNILLNLEHSGNGIYTIEIKAEEEIINKKIIINK